MINKDENSNSQLWFFKWVRMPYDIKGKGEMFKKRKELVHGTYTNDELKLPYEKYISSPFEQTPASEFDPFSFNKSYKVEEPPYLELIKLDVESETAILEFVNKYGLLGIMYHIYRWFNIEASHNTPDIGSNTTSENKELYSKWHKFGYDDSPIYPMSENKIEALKQNITILKEDIDYVITTFLNRKANSDSYKPVKIKYMNDTFSPLNIMPYENEPCDLIAKEKEFIASPYFYSNKYQPNDNNNKTKETRAGYLAPLYTEPLELFIAEVNKFKNIYSKIARIETMDQDEDSLYLLLDVYFDLWKNITSVHPKPNLDMNNRELTFGWEIPSLLSAYYLMLFLDLTKKMHLRFCVNEKCINPVASIRGEKKYCGKLCRNLVRKQKQLRKEKSFKEEMKSACNRYKPENVKYLLVAEFDRKTINNDYFYFEDRHENDQLFTNTIRALYSSEYQGLNKIRMDKAKLLERLKQEGFYMIDASKKDRQTKIVLSTLRRAIKEVTEITTKIIVISTDNYELIANHLINKGYNVINKDKIEFPHAKNKNSYKEKIRILLNENGRKTV